MEAKFFTDLRGFRAFSGKPRGQKTATAFLLDEDGKQE